MAANLADGYSGVVPMENWGFGPAFAGAGALRSTARDLLRYLAANMGLVVSPLYPAMTNAHAIRADALTRSSIGLAWFTTTGSVEPMIWHDGGTGGYRSFAGFLQSRKLGVAVLANSDYEVDDLGFHLLDSAQPLSAITTPGSVAADTLAGCVGRYKVSDSDHFDIGLEHDHLTAAYSGDRGTTFTLYPSTGERFFATLVDATAEFPTNNLGGVGRMVWTQGGTSMSFPRVTTPTRLSIQRRSDGAYLRFVGDPGVSYIVEASADLQQWTAISTNTLATLPVVDPAASGGRFYRLRRP
jgi:hypothetical protein